MLIYHDNNYYNNNHNNVRIKCKKKKCLILATPRLHA